MSKKKKNGNEDRTTTYIIFVTAILGLIEIVMEIIKELVE